MSQVAGLENLVGKSLGLFRAPDDLAFVVKKAEGTKLYGDDGRTYLDYVIGRGPMVLGHSHPRVVDAICRQAALGTHFYVMNEHAPKLAQMICRMVPCAEQVRFVADGSEATFYAMRLARAFTGRTKIMKFAGAYHGHHDYAQHGGKPDRRGNDGTARADTSGVPKEVASTMLISPYNDLAAAQELFNRHKDEIAAIIVEPVQRAIPSAPGFLEGLRKLCDGKNTLYIIDEVVTGFRLAMGGAQEVFGIKADICTLGKILGGGLPLGALAGRKDIMELADNNRQDDGRSALVAGTLNGNPLSCAAGAATLEVLEEENGPKLMEKAGTIVADGFRDCAKRLSIPFQMMGPPSFQEAIFDERPIRNVDDYLASNKPARMKFGVEMLKRGIFVIPGGKLNVSILHTPAEADVLCAAAFEAMREVRDSGLLEKK